MTHVDGHSGHGREPTSKLLHHGDRAVLAARAADSDRRVALVLALIPSSTGVSADV